MSGPLFGGLSSLGVPFIGGSTVYPCGLKGPHCSLLIFSAYDIKPGIVSII
jgi:hypothetical protein